jgi:hypothetical protein
MPERSVAAISIRSFGTVQTICVLLPLAISAFCSVRPTVGPPLTVTVDRPALVFESYLADQSQITAESKPVISEDFFFRNQGEQTVRITKIEPSCGCLAPQLSAQEFAPGETGRITLPIRTANEPAGLREYMVNISYEDPQPRTVSIFWRVRLPEKKLLIEPRVLMVLGDLSTSDEYAVRISDFRPGRTGTPLRITGVTAAPRQIQAQVSGQTAGGDVSETQISVKFSKDLPPGRHRGMITVETDDADYPALQIPVIVGRAESGLENRVMTSPEMGRVVIRRNRPEESAGTEIVLTTPTDWTITELETWPPQMSASAAAVVPAENDLKRTGISISVTELPPTGILQALLTVHCITPNGPRMITVPLSVVWL